MNKEELCFHCMNCGMEYYIIGFVDTKKDDGYCDKCKPNKEVDKWQDVNHVEKTSNGLKPKMGKTIR